MNNEPSGYQSKFDAVKSILRVDGGSFFGVPGCLGVSPGVPTGISKETNLSHYFIKFCAQRYVFHFKNTLI